MIERTRASARPPARGAWSRPRAEALSAESLRALLHNEIPAIVIPAFASPAECAELVDRSRDHGFQSYRDVSPPINRIGVTVFEYDRIGTEAYFRDAEAARAIQRRIFASSFDPLRRFVDLVAASHAGAVGVAADDRLGSYHAGLIRRIEAGTLLHIDFAAAEHPKWKVGSVRAQLAWNLYLALDGTAEQVGPTHVYDRHWLPELEHFKEAGTYGYAREVLDGAPRFTFHPGHAEVWIFNTRNFHEVEPSQGSRVTFTSAMGLFDDGAIYLWS